MPATADPAAPPAFGVADLEILFDVPEFKQAAPDERARMLDDVLAGAFDEITAAPDYSPDTYQAFGYLAGAARQRLDEMHSTWEKTKETGGKAWGFIKGFATDVGTTLRGVAEAAGAGANASAGIRTPTPVADAMTRGSAVGGNKWMDTLDVALSKAAGADKPFNEALDALKADVDAGNFPTSDPAAYNQWLAGHSDKTASGQYLYWTDATENDRQRFALANDPDARALLAGYIRTRNPETWKQLSDTLKATPARRAANAEEADIVANSPGAKWMRETFGAETPQHLVSAADPVQLAGYVMPMLRTTRAVAAAEAAANASTLASRALAAGKGVAKGMPEQAAFGAATAVQQNPEADAGDIAQAVTDQMIGGAAIGGLTFGAGEAVRGVGGLSSKKRPQMRSENGTSELTPEVDAPPPDAPPTDTAPPPGDPTPGPPAPEAPPADTRPPYRVLRDAGFTLDEAKALHDRQDARSITDPESARTLAEQFALMRAGRKPGVFFDGLTPEELPATFRPIEGDGLAILPVGDSSSIVYDTRAFDPETAAAKIQADEIGDLLGYGVPRKPAAGDRVAVLRARDGHEVVSVVIDDASEVAVMDSLQRMAEPEAGDVLSIEPIDQVIADRDTYRRAERQSVADEVAHWQAMETDNADFLAAAKAKAKRSFAAKKGAGLPPYPRAEGETGLPTRDILDDIVDSGGIYLPPRGERRGGDSDYSKRIADAIPPRYMSIFSERGEGADFVATQLGFERVDDMAEAIISAVQNRINLRQQYAARAASERQVEKQAISFGKQALDPPAKTKETRQSIAASELNVGDVVEIAGERVRVREIDPDTMDVTLEDGAKFGVQRITDADVIYVEGYQPRALSDSLEFLPPESGWEQTPAPLELETQTPGDVVADRQAEATKARDAAAREQLAEKARAPLRGDSSDVGQGRLFQEDSDLFSGPSAEQLGGTAANVARASLPPGPMPAGPATASPGPAVSLTEIRHFLLDKVGLPAVGVRRFNQRALGIYKMRPEVIRMRAINDLPTLAHEIGHHLHAKLDPTAPATSPTNFGGRFDTELMPLGRVTSRPSYTREMVRREGVAEFTRLWLTDPAKALAAAPTFSAHFAGNLPTDMLAGLETGRKMVQQYINQPALTKLGSQVVFDMPRERKSVGDFLRAGYAKWVNTLQPVTDVLKAAKRTDPSLATAADRVQAALENHRGGWQAKAHADVFLEQSDLNGRVVGPSLKEILKDLPPDRIEDFSRYIAIKRAMELESAGKRSGFDFAGATGWQRELPAWERQFEPARRELLAFQDRTVQLLADAGVISDRDLATMRQANRDYVPFYRLFEKANGVSLGPNTGGQGVVNNGSGIRRLKGSDRAVVDPLQSIVKNAFFFRKLAENNRIGVQFFDVLQRLQGAGRWADEIAKRRTPVNVPHAEVVKTLIDAGVIAAESDLPQGTDLAFQLWKMVQRPDPAIGEVIVRKGGKTQHWQVRDPMLLEALKHSDTETISVLRHLGPTLGKIVSLPTRLLRWGATAHPIFAATNWTRDQLSAAVYSKTGFIPFWDGVRGAVHVLNKDATYREWVRSGGKFAGQATYDAGLRLTLQDALPKDRGGKALVRTLASPRNWKRALGVASEILEEATRVQEFARGRARGLSPVEAANLSKEVTLNFARAGERSRLLNQVIAFFNASLQDMDKFGREHANPATRGRTIMRGLMWITVPSVLTWALGKDDPDIQNLPQWRRDFFWNISLHPVANALGRRGFVLSIPKPFLTGAVYGTSVERALDAATGRDPNGARKAARNIAANTLFRGDLVAGITALQPLVELATNYDFFTGGEVVPDRLSGVPAAMQFTTATSQTARAMGKLTGISPLAIDHLIGGYLGSIGTNGVGALDWAINKAAGADAVTPPTKDLFEYPPFRSFSPSPYTRSAYADRFYTAMKDVEGLVATWNKQAPQLTTAEQAAWWQKNGAAVQHYQQVIDRKTKLTRVGAVRKAAKGLSDLNKAMREVKADPKLTGDQKRQRLMDLTDQYNQAAQQAFNRLFDPETKRKAF